ncbi:MAG: HD domain-containing protein [Halanaerobiales bacterium]|nr:HD domain-containing protein [Halanaerobiales bacterium]
MIKELHVSLIDIIISLSNALDLISPNVTNHHKRVAYIASSIAAELGMSKNEEIDLIIAGILHDIGVFSIQERLTSLDFDLQDPYTHAKKGYFLLKNYGPFSEIAPLVLHHHAKWNNEKSSIDDYIPLGGHILHLADRIDVLSDRKKNILNQKRDISEKINQYSGNLFAPELVEIFNRLAKKECFWLNMVSPTLGRILKRKTKFYTVELNLEGLQNLAKLFSKIIDFRSRFTVTHSSGVAATAEGLALIIGMSKREGTMLKVAGYLHDLGKLAIDSEILDKPGKLTDDEFNLIKGHTYHTYNILEAINGLEEINTWASFHHEKLDGSGYPFHHHGEDLPLGSRIMAVADVFTAITEDRPYRKGMSKNKVIDVLHNMVKSSALDNLIVTVLLENYDHIDKIRREAQATDTEDYERFEEEVG